MSLLDQLGGILNQYSSGNTPPPEQAPQHLQQVAAQVPQDTLSGLLTKVFQSPETGSFGENIAQMFRQSNPQQQAGILTKLIHSAGPEVLSQLGINLPGGASAAVTPEQARQVSPDNVKDIANRAQRQNPDIVKEAGEFYSQHPHLVQALGAGAAIWALRHVHL